MTRMTFFVFFMIVRFINSAIAKSVIDIYFASEFNEGKRNPRPRLCSGAESYVSGFLQVGLGLEESIYVKAI